MLPTTRNALVLSALFAVVVVVDTEHKAVAGAASAAAPVSISARPWPRRRVMKAFIGDRRG